MIKKSYYDLLCGPEILTYLGKYQQTRLPDGKNHIYFCKELPQSCPPAQQSHAPSWQGTNETSYCSIAPQPHSNKNRLNFKCRPFYQMCGEIPLLLEYAVPWRLMKSSTFSESFKISSLPRQCERSPLFLLLWENRGTRNTQFCLQSHQEGIEP